MKSFIICFLFSVACGQIFDLGTECGLGTSDVSRIVGGTKAKKGNWGWQAAVHEKGYQVCGGALINEQWVLTAAHCVDNTNPKRYVIDLGNHDLSTPLDSYAVSSKVSRVIKHPKYDEYTMHNDIALFKLESKVKLDTERFRVFPACIPDGSEVYEERKAWVTGYGATGSNKQGSDVLLQADVMTLSNKRCVERFRSDGVDTTQQICAGEKGGSKDTCQGDSGGPLNIKGNDGRWHLVGLTSYGPHPCGDGTVYVRVSAFKEWIKATIQEN